MTSKAFIPAALLTLLPLAAFAQTGETSAQATNQGGPMVVERVYNGFLVEPDVKITEVDKRTSELVGAHAGWVFGEQFLIGGGGYVLANPTRDRRMGYGGLVVAWLARPHDSIGFSVKGLVGAGGSDLFSTRTELVRAPGLHEMHGFPGSGPIDVDRYIPTTFRVRRNQAFFVAEPEADLLVRFSRMLRLTVGAGYRFTGQRRGSGNGLDGAVGTIGLQLGWLN